MTNLQQIENIISAIDISSEKQVLLNGSRYEEEFKDEYLDKPGNKMIFEAIHRLIYEIFYTKTDKQAQPPNVSTEALNESAKQLSKANPSAERFDEGWYVEDIDSMGNITAIKGNMKRRVRAGEFLTDNGIHQPVEKGVPIRLYMPKEMKRVQPVFYYMYGNATGEENSTEVVRVYFNLSFEGNGRLIKLLGNCLNSYAVPFIFKCLCHPALYTRADSAVLYVEKKYTSVVFAIVEEVYQQVKQYIKDDTPLFTRPLGRGISFAETPPRLDESFGTHWSKIIAAGIMNAYEAGLPKENWLTEVIRHITNGHGYIDMEKLYLNPGSAYPYQFIQYE